MSAVRKPRTMPRPKLSDDEKTEMIVNEMILLASFPKHEQVAEFRRNIEWAKQNIPAQFAHAEILFNERQEREKRLKANPAECSRCHGAGLQEFHGLKRFCGCPAGDRAMRTSFLPTPQPPKLAEVGPKKSDRQLLAEVASWAGEEGQKS